MRAYPVIVRTILDLNKPLCRRLSCEPRYRKDCVVYVEYGRPSEDGILTCVRFDDTIEVGTEMDSY